MTLRILLLLALLLPHTSSAREKQYAFRHLSVNEGLSQNTVLAIIQDRTGFMWFGTKDGLNRYDGTEIRTVTAIDAIPGNNYITALCEDTQGYIWIGTDAGVCLYDPLTEQSRRFLQQADDGSFITGNIPQIVLAPDSTVWIPAGAQGFFRYDPCSQLLTRIRSDKEGARPYTARNLCFLSHEMAVITLDDGNIYRSEDDLQSIEPLLAGGGTEAFRDRFVNRLIAGPYNRIYVCSALGLYEVNPTTGQFRKIRLPHSNDYVRDMLAVKNDEIWVATESCLEILDGNLQETASFYSLDKSPYMLQDLSIYCLCKDREGGMWAGTYFAGVSYSRGGSSSLRRYYANTQGRQLGWHVREIAEDADGLLWIGTESKSLFRYDPQTDEIEPVWGSGLLSSNIHGLCCDGDYIWVGTYELNRSLIRIHRRTLSEKSYPSAGQEIYTVCKTSNGELWLGTTSGLKRYDRTLDRFVADTAIRSHIHHLKEDSSGNLWAATYSDGLYGYDALKQTWRHFLYDESDTTSLAANKVLNLFEDSRSQLWLTTEGGGLCRYRPESGTFVRYKSCLPFDTLYRIEEDAQGFLWITSNKGLVRFDPRTLHHFVFTTDDGLLNNQFNYSSSCRTRNGRIYAGSSNGFISFDPAELKPRDHPWPIVLTDFLLYDKSIGAGSEFPLEKSITQLDRIELAPDENAFSLRVAAINYQSPHEVRMRYRLEGFDTDWHPVRNNTISYSNLPYRSYRLTVEGLGSDGRPNGSERTLEIRIRPPFYLSGFAQACYVLFALGFVVLLYTIANRRAIRMREERIEKFERQKERELYVAKFDFFTNVAHEIRTPLSLIRGPLENIALKERNSPDRELCEDIRTLEQNTDRLTVLINQLLDFRKAEKGGFQLHPAECDIRPIVRAVYDRFLATARQRRLELSAELPHEELLASVDREALTKIVSNLLSNAVKFAESRILLTLASDPENSSVRIVLSNDGPIVPLDQRERIFHSFVQYRDGKHTVAGTGIGLTLARSLAELHGGKLEMDRATEINRFILTIPIHHEEKAVPAAEELPQRPEAGESPATVAAGPAHPSLLIVEDDPDMLAFVSRQLAATYEITTAEHGAAALDLLESGRSFDLIVSDVMMPRMDGFELCRSIKSDLRFSHIPLLLLTAKIDTASKVEGLDTGADAYVEKPFSPEYLRASIAALRANRERIRRHFLESPDSQAEALAHTGVDRDFLGRLNAFIGEHIQEIDLSVDDMAAAVYMSSSTLLNKLKELTGIRPNEYLRLERMKRAATLLLQKRYSIADVSVLVGFRTQAYFTACFKKQFGITPSEFIEGGGDRTTDDAPRDPQHGE